jgi:hypothetical protein
LASRTAARSALDGNVKAYIRFEAIRRAETQQRLEGQPSTAVAVRDNFLKSDARREVNNPGLVFRRETSKSA